MRRFLFAVGLLATVAVSGADAGYVIVRLILHGADGGAAGPADGPGSGRPGRPGFGPGSSYPGMMAPGGMHPGGAGDKTESADPTRSIFVVVPFTKKPERRHFYSDHPPHSYHNPMWEAGLTHPFGSTNLLIDNTQFQWYMEFAEDPAVGRTRQTVVRDKHARWQKNPADSQVLLDILTEALERGMVADAVKYADELLAFAKEKKGPTTRQVDQFAKAYEALQRPLRESIRRGEGGPAWKDRLQLAYPGALDLSSPHYHVIYWDMPEDVRTRRVNELEENFKAFYLLHAVQGTALPVPDRPLVAFLPKSGRDTVNLGRSLDGFPFVADACYTPDHDVLVLSPERLDGVGQTFQRQAQQIFREGANRKELLAGRGPWPLDTSGEVKGRKKPEDVAEGMTWAMVERYADDEAEWAGVSREGNRQLLYATGLLPRHVSLPTWLSEGSADYYARPKGPVFTQKDPDKTAVTLALTTGYGVPNYVRQKQFKELIDHREVAADPGLLLRRAVGDTYFAAIRTGVDADDPKLPRPPVKPKTPADGAGSPKGPGFGPMGGPMGGPRPPFGGPGPVGPGAQEDDPAALARRRQEFLVTKAYATSWALYFHLARNEPDGLARYLAELNKLPRDLPLDETARVEVFARAFNLPDAAAATAFGAKWLDAMKTVPPAGVEFQLTEPEPPKDDGGPGGPGGPGDPTRPKRPRGPMGPPGS